MNTMTNLSAPGTRRTLSTSSSVGGFALMVTMLVVVVIALLATGAVVVGSAHILGNAYYERQSVLDAVALEGLEFARARINGDDSLYPADGFAVLENGVSVIDPDGTPIPGVKRWTYVGPTGSASGQFGVFGGIVSVVRHEAGGQVVRRSQVFQESFAKFAYFTDVEPSNIRFGGGDQLFGPVHTNSDLQIWDTGATFHDEVTTAGSVVGGQYGTFKKGYEAGVSRIEMPETAEVDKLRTQATIGGTAFTTSSPSGMGEARLRIEFVAIDLDGDGSVTGADEGFFKAYRSTDEDWLSGDVPSGVPPFGGMRRAEHCGHYHGSTFVSADDHPNNGPDSWTAALSSSSRRCYLGGSDEIVGGFQANDGNGEWVEWTGAVHPGLVGRPDANYLFPLARSLNPDFKGVIHVDGNVLISGVLRGRVTVSSSRDIIIGDDITYASDPGLGTCADILGMFSTDDVVVADNTLNAPIRPSPGFNRFTYDDTKDEFIHGIVLALDNFTVEDYAGGSERDERCEGDLWGRGCLYLTGGIIQNTRGAVGTIAAVGG
ncbi:MAG: hypothetical protein RQ745_05120, partial [Longimicrobiales bacterium]|nr:hypothetical protein [Longimicrobiales bacterium]